MVSKDKDKKKKELMNAFELAIAKTLTKTDLDPLGAAAVILKLALNIYHDQLKDKYAVEEVIFHALKTIDTDWFDDNMEDIMSQMNKLDQRQQLMVVTMEECGELVQACSKILRRQELYADTKYVQNLKDEIGDVYTMLKLMVEHDVVSWDELEKRNDHKREKLKRWSDLIE